MRVFISWSGEWSRRFAEVIRENLPGALQFVKPYFSPSDTEKGARWEAIITEQLDATQVGLFVLTSESLNSRWLHFEAGAVSRGNTKVCTMLFGIEQTDVQGPLEHFQATKYTEEDMQELFRTINAAAGEQRLDAATLNSVFEMWWPKLKEGLDKVLADMPAAKAKREVRTEKELLQEVLVVVRGLARDADLNQMTRAIVGPPSDAVTPNIVTVFTAPRKGMSPRRVEFAVREAFMQFPEVVDISSGAGGTYARYSLGAVPFKELKRALNKIRQVGVSSVFIGGDAVEAGTLEMVDSP